MLIAGLHAHHAAIVEANGSNGLTLGPILKDFAQMAVVIRNTDGGLGRTERRPQFAGRGADLDTGNLGDGRFLNYRLSHDGYDGAAAAGSVSTGVSCRRAE